MELCGKPWICSGDGHQQLGDSGSRNSDCFLSRLVLNLCPAGTYSTAIGSSCVPCPQGTYSFSPGSGMCTLCPAGSASPAVGANSSSTCVLCTPGSFSSSAGSQTCSVCSVGMYASFAGAVSCPQCPAGSYASSTGSVTCDMCAAGTYNENSGSTSTSSCVRGPLGTSSPQQGAPAESSCQLCPLGYKLFAVSSIQLLWDPLFVSCVLLVQHRQELERLPVQTVFLAHQGTLGQHLDLLRALLSTRNLFGPIWSSRLSDLSYWLRNIRSGLTSANSCHAPDANLDILQTAGLTLSCSLLALCTGLTFNRFFSSWKLAWYRSRLKRTRRLAEFHSHSQRSAGHPADNHFSVDIRRVRPSPALQAPGERTSSMEQQFNPVVVEMWDTKPERKDLQLESLGENFSKFENEKRDIARLVENLENQIVMLNQRID